MRTVVKVILILLIIFLWSMGFVNLILFFIPYINSGIHNLAFSFVCFLVASQISSEITESEYNKKEKDETFSDF